MVNMNNVLIKQNKVTIYQKSKDYNMHPRKNRIPFQGVSNYTSTQFHPVACPKQISTPLQTQRFKNNSPFSNQKNFSFDVQNKVKTPCVRSTQVDSKTLLQIRKAYKGKSNVWRMAKSWKFNKQGFIDKNQLKHHLQAALSIVVPQRQIDLIAEKFGTAQGRIDIENFLKIIYGQSSNYSFKPRLFDVDNKSPYREQKMDNLIQKLDTNTYDLKKISRHQSQQSFQTNINTKQIQKIGHLSGQIQNQKKFNKSQKGCYKSINSKTQSRQKLGSTFSQFSKEQFFRVTQNSFNKLRKLKKSFELHPSLLAEQNQTKTRFGASFNPSKSGGFHDIMAGSNYQNKQTSNYITQQKQNKTKKFERKLEKLRQTQQNQRSNIQRIEIKQMERQQGRLLRKRFDKQAYQYSSFLKNKWL